MTNNRLGPMADPFPNPETAWHAERGTPQFSRDDIIARVGPCNDPIQPLSGGLANATFRLGDDRVLRLYQRDTTALAKEAALLSQPWETFRTPLILERGVDFLILEYVPHRPLENSALHGSEVGRALAEIHRQRVTASGLLDDTFEIAEPFPDFVQSMADHISSLTPASDDREVYRRVSTALIDAKARLTPYTKNPVRLHGDFKPSNLHWTQDNRLLVLDWEFTFGGPALMDIAQLARWGMPDPFRSAFETTYRSNGGRLEANWRDLAETLDLANLAGLLAKSTSPSARRTDLLRRIATSLDKFQSG